MNNLREASSYPTARKCLRIDFVSSVFFGIPIMATYYYDKGLTPFEVYILQSTIAITTIVVDIPTGYFGDRFSHKGSIVTGFVGHTATWIYFAVCQELWQFILAVAWSSVFHCLVTSSTSAIVLTSHGREACATYDTAAVQFATAGRFIGILGGMAMVGLGDTHLPFILQPLVSVAAVIFALRLPSQKSELCFERNWKETWSLFVKMTIKRLDVRWLIIFNATLHTTLYGAFWIFQLQLTQAGWDESWFGFFYLLINLGVVGSTLAAGRFQRRTSVLQMRLLTIAVGLCLFMASALPDAASLWSSGITYCLIVAFAWPLTLNRLRHVMHEVALPATQQSVVSACAAILFATLGPYVGWVAQGISIATAYLGLAIFTCLGCGTSIWLHQRNSSGV